MKTPLLLILSLLFLQGCTPQHSENKVATAEPITGLFQYMADAPLITLCSTEKRYPVAMEGAYIELERAYLKSGVEPGSKAWVQVEGELGQRPAMEGEGKQAFFIVDHFDNIDPDRQCASKEAVSLEGQEWQLVEMPGTDLNIPKDKPPTLYFDHKEKRITGFAGCNRFFGNYQREGEHLEIGPLGSTRMSCGDLDLFEYAFLEQLIKVRRWQVMDHQLSLFNDQQVLLIFKIP
jgi:copper homeostasis protein (lipoprotein)